METKNEKYKEDLKKKLETLNSTQKLTFVFWLLIVSCSFLVPILHVWCSVLFNEALLLKKMNERVVNKELVKSN